MSKVKTIHNPLSGLSVPAVEDLADEVLSHFGIGTIDLADPAQKKKLRHYICVSMRSALMWRVFPELEKATSKALAHVLALMEDPDYQEVRRERQSERIKRARERQAEHDKQNAIDREARKQKQRGLVQ